MMLVPKTSTFPGSLPGALPINVLELKVGLPYCDLMQTPMHARHASKKRSAAPNALVLTSILGINPIHFVVIMETATGSRLNNLGTAALMVFWLRVEGDCSLLRVHERNAHCEKQAPRCD